jgi:radical SAM superfamily enzyme YgiQ (UPF0313 family)
MTWEVVSRLRALAAEEEGTLRKDAETRVALVYPSPYAAAMSSLGYQTIYRVLNELPGVAADRATAPDMMTIEREAPVGDYPIVAFSVAYELELAGVVEALDKAGIPALAADREDGGPWPLVVGGGPLTFSNPVPLGPFCEVILLGEGEQIVVELIEAAREASGPAPRSWPTWPHGRASTCRPSTASASRRWPRRATTCCRRAR